MNMYKVYESELREYYFTYKVTFDVDAVTEFLEYQGGKVDDAVVNIFLDCEPDLGHPNLIKCVRRIECRRLTEDDD